MSTRFTRRTRITPVGVQINAFRRDERVRRLLSPLLRIQASRNSIYSAGDIFYQQIQAFETLFKTIDKE